MSRKEKVHFSETASKISSNILCSSNENMLPPKFPVLKSKGRVLANAVNRDLNQKKVHGKAALERQRDALMSWQPWDKGEYQRVQSKISETIMLFKMVCLHRFIYTEAMSESNEENASKLASGRSVVDKADKENEIVRNKPEVKSKISQGHKIIQPQLKVSKIKGVLEERKNKLVKSESLISLYTKEEISKIEKGVKALNVVSQIEEESRPVVVEEKPNPIVIKEEPHLEVTKLPPCANLIDKEDRSNSEFLLGIYADDIHRFLKHLETTQAIRKDYLTSSHIMTQNMRSLLVDWLFEVQHSFKLLNETTHIAIALLDRFMQDHPNIPKNELQLVGVSCVFLASKYEEMYPPDLDDLMDISAKTYTKEQIIKMEQLIFSSLNYQMGRPSPLQFLRRYGRAAKVDITCYCLAKYFIDLSLVSYALCHVPPSLMAASALYLSLFLLLDDSESEFWTPALVYYSDYTWKNMKPVVCELASIVWNVPNSKYKTVKNIYLDPKKFNCVSALRELRSEKLYKLSQNA